MLAMTTSRARYERPQIKARGVLIASDPASARLLDIIGSIVALAFFAPLMIVIAFVIFVSDPGPVVFRQTRVGRNGKHFTCLKFRTMAIDAEARLAQLLRTDPQARAEWARDHKLRNDPRVVGVGNFLRKSSLDELPQFFNVLMGEMSLVGPRPIVPDEVVRYGKYFRYYCQVRPGLTGLWQISGRNDVCYRRRVAFDVVYVRHGKLGDNLKILLLTLPSVVTSRGSY